jgi:hypothetical protein
MENLREKGFTTADAMRAFDVRTVSAFSALSRNIDTVKSFEGQMLLTSAATEAASTDGITGQHLGPVRIELHRCRVHWPQTHNGLADANPQWCRSVVGP